MTSDDSSGSQTPGPPPRRARLGDPVAGLVGLLAVYRLLYHLYYLRDVPFSVATFSDGRQYEEAALDILAHPPWGSEPFYLQGIYAYFLAVPMTIRPWVSLGLLLQLAVAGAGWWLFARTLRRALDRRAALWATAVALAYPMLMFYENKYLTASLAVVACIVLLWATVEAGHRRTAGWWVLVGVATGLTVLWRPNFALVVPFVGWAVWEAHRRARRPALRAGLFVAVGLVASLAPMMVRNAVVTGRATVVPAHGGGTSFYIGNNATANGVWNDANGLLSGDVGKERTELLTELDIDSPDPKGEVPAIGRALYRRGFAEIAADPGRWLALEAKKLWLLVGNDELTQDYDLHGEIAMMPYAHRVGIPYAVLEVVGLVGLVVLVRRSRREPEIRPWLIVTCGLGLCVVAANLAYFTSSQHRLPLALVWAVGFVPGAKFILGRLRDRKFVLVLAASVAVGLALLPRTKKREPSAVFFYNLSLAYRRLGDEVSAGWALDRAIDRRPDHPVILLERARLRRDHGEWEKALEDLGAIDAAPDTPRWVEEQVRIERSRIYGMSGLR